MVTILYVRKKVDKEFLICFGKNLKQIRENQKISQAQLAIDCDFEISQISRIERGVINTSLSNIKIIANKLEVEIKTLFEFEIKQTNLK